MIWGVASPSAPYGAFRTTEVATLLQGAPGLLFDQEYGLLPVAPALWLAMIGLLAMLREPTARRTALEIGAIVLSLLFVVGAFNLWWGGSASVGRPMIAALPLLSAPIAWRFHHQGRSRAAQAAYVGLVVVSLAIVFILATVAGGLLLATQKNGIAPLLEWASPSWNLAALAPSFIVSPPSDAMSFVIVWVTLSCIGGLALKRTNLAPGRAGLLAIITGSGIVAMGSLCIPTLLADRMQAPTRLQARSKIRLLNMFSPSRRPIAIQYNPLGLIAAENVPALFRLVARAGDKRPEQPVALLHNARWSLAAGRYRVDIFARAGAEAATNTRLALQLGRLGAAAEAWDVVLDRDGRWSTTFTLPIFVNSVGFQATPALESLEPALVLQPITIDDIREKPPAREVLQTARYGSARVFFHDDWMRPEPKGFWTRGGATSVITLATSGAELPRLRLRAGPIDTRVRLSVNDSRQQFTLAAHQTHDVTTPKGLGSVWEMRLETPDAFVPSELDPDSNERRRLGCWVEIIAPRMFSRHRID